MMHRALAWILVLSASACASLPVIVPDLARARDPPVRLEGSAGPLSALRSRQILDRLHAAGEDTGIFRRHLALEEALAGNPLTAGNAVRLLEDGPSTYRAMLAAIEAATDHVNLETYILEDDEVGRRFADALLACQRRGVQVNLIRDGVGTLGTPALFFATLEAAGIAVLEYNPVNPLQARGEWALNNRDHRKLLVVDGRVAFLGGINISSVYSGGSFASSSRLHADGSPAWRDTDLRVEGPVVADLQRLFIATWEGQRGPPLAPRAYFPALAAAGEAVVRAIGSSPDEPFSQIYATLLSAIGAAETSIRITNAYFVPDPQLLDALEAAAARGVAVQLVLPASTDAWLVFHAGRHQYGRLLRAGVRIHERRGVILHAKTALVDGVWATVGSTNLDWRSFLHNRELDAVILDVTFAAQLEAMFERDLLQSDAVTSGQWRRRPLRDRLLEQFANLWAYWL